MKPLNMNPRRKHDETDLQGDIMDLFALHPDKVDCWRNNQQPRRNSKGGIFFPRGFKPGRGDIIGFTMRDVRRAWYDHLGTPHARDYYRGTFINIEVKSPKGKLSPAQVEFKDKVEKAGGIFIEARSLDDVMFLVGK